MALEIENSKAKIVIVDNITWLKSNNEAAKDALPLMKHLKKLKHTFELSILALAHTPKRDGSRPLNSNDLAGSRMLMNFCDSSFAIGESSQDVGIRYLKQIKERATHKVYGFDNIVVCEVLKDSNFLGFKYKDEEPEGQHLKSPSEEDITKRRDDIASLHGSGKNPTDIAKQLNL